MAWRRAEWGSAENVVLALPDTGSRVFARDDGGGLRAIWLTRWALKGRVPLIRPFALQPSHSSIALMALSPPIVPVARLTRARLEAEKAKAAPPSSAPSGHLLPPGEKGGLVERRVQPDHLSSEPPSPPEGDGLGVRGALRWRIFQRGNPALSRHSVCGGGGDRTTALPDTGSRVFARDDWARRSGSLKGRRGAGAPLQTLSAALCPITSGS